MEIRDPKKLTEEVRLKIEQAAAMDCTMDEIALFANVSKGTLYNWMESDAKFKERLNALRASPVLAARSTVIGALKNPEYAFKYLERKAKKEFSPHTTSDITSDGKPIVIPGDLHGKHREPDPGPEPDRQG